MSKILPLNDQTNDLNPGEISHCTSTPAVNTNKSETSELENDFMLSDDCDVGWEVPEVIYYIHCEVFMNRNVISLLRNIRWLCTACSIKCRADILHIFQNI